MAKRYLRKKAVCERYGGVTPRTIERLVKDGVLPAPEFPFQNKIPVWDEAALDEHDRSAVVKRAGSSNKPRQSEPEEAQLKQKPPSLLCAAGASFMRNDDRR